MMTTHGHLQIVAQDQPRLSQKRNYQKMDQTASDTSSTTPMNAEDELPRYIF